MLVILRYWQQALALCAPSRFFSLVQVTAKKYVQALVRFVLFFKILFVGLLVAWYFCPQEVFMIQELVAQEPEKLLAQSSVVWWIFVFSVAEFMIHAGFLLFIRRKGDELSTKEYVRSFMLRYVQCALMFSIIMLFVVAFFASLGVTTLPQIHWGLVVFVRTLELIIMFFWLDSPFTIKDFFIALEKGVNFVVYNVPFLAVVLILGFMSQFLLKIAVCGVPVAYADIFGFLSGRLELVTPVVAGQELAAWRVLLFKYLKCALDFFWICFIWVVYDRRKTITYSKSFFS
ncbi:hypothetical protein K2X40_02060 [Candidatus Babeliales bacterium]|nr:hypothetical protein [Candidatus Babeliales bacterium]